ncbi:hypothetical protein, partial [Escherichia coli]|uniref:hypothetical protein n=1 Tax=Escherichia coli TaxID=562 RepID=UPI001953F627
YKRSSLALAMGSGLGNEEERLLAFWLVKFKRAGAELEGEAAKVYADLTSSKMENITKYNLE